MNMMTVRGCVISDRVLVGSWCQIVAGNDADPNNSVIPLVGNHNVLRLDLIDKAPDRLGSARATSLHPIAILLLKCGQHLVFVTVLPVVRQFQPAEADAAPITEQFPVLGAPAGAAFPYLSH